MTIYEIRFFAAPIFTPSKNGLLSSNWQVDESLNKAMLSGLDWKPCKYDHKMSRPFPGLLPRSVPYNSHYVWLAIDDNPSVPEYCLSASRRAGFTNASHSNVATRHFAYLFDLIPHLKRSENNNAYLLWLA